MMKSKKLVLDNFSLENEFFEDVRLLGIVCPFEPYQLAWKLVEMLNYQFVRNSNYDIDANEKVYSVFTYERPQIFQEHYLISNRNKSNYLLSDIKNIDFIWMQKGNIFNQPELEKLPSALKRVNGLVHLFEIDSSKLAQRQYLII